MPDIKDLLEGMASSKERLANIVTNAKKDKYISKAIEEFSLTDEEIVRYYPLLSIYSEEKKAEETCSGIDDCSLPTPHCLSKLTMENGILTREVVCCPCYQKIVNRRKAFIFADFDPELIKESPAKLKKYANGSNVLNALGGSKKNKEKRWTYINDETDKCFKYVVSYLSWCGEKGESVAFINFPNYIESLRGMDKFQQEAKAKKMNLVKNTDILVISSFGSEYKSDYVRDSFVMPLLRERALKKKETIFISPYEKKDLPSLYNGEEKVGNVIGKELVRIMDQNVQKDIRFQAGVEESF